VNAQPSTLTPRTSQPLWDPVNRFLAWLESSGYDSFDPYDIWGTQYSLFARKFYYKKGIFGAPLVAPVLLLEMLAPGLRRLFVKKQRFATADGQLVLAYLNLHRNRGESGFLTKAKLLGEDLIRSSVPGYSGLCWGYPFDWQNNTALWRKHTPFITTGPYCFEAFLGLFEATGDLKFREAAASTARFVYSDLRDTPSGPGVAAASYSPIDNTKVINATAYRAFVLFEAAHQLGASEYTRKAEQNLNFILESQRDDGSWLYALDSPGEGFIDHFHTCFVLKNLWKISFRLRRPEIERAIKNGYAYYRKALFDAEDNPKSFAIQPRLQLVRLDLYNIAEAITLGVLLRNEIPEAFALAKSLGAKLVNQYQLPNGHFVTRVYFGGWRHTFPYLRWPQAQLFYALTNLLDAGE
jgi:hypothetical protein